MAIEVKTLEAKDVQSNQLNLCGELTNAGNYDAVLAYFMYSKDENLNETYKSDKCALIDAPDTYELIQDNIDDNIYYYYKATAENYEMTETQLEHIENLSYLNINADKFSNQFFVNTVLASPNAFTQFMINENYTDFVWSSSNLDMLVSGEHVEFNDNYLSLNASGGSNYNMSLNQSIDFSKINKLNVDVEKAGDNYGNELIIYINDNNILETSSTFDRKTIEADVSDINSISDLKIEANSSSYDKVYLDIYNVWGE